MKQQATIIEYKPEEWITLERARMTQKNGVGITRKSMMNKVRAHKIPAVAVRKSSHGNYFFHEPTLKGLTN